MKKCAFIFVHISQELITQAQTFKIAVLSLKINIFVLRKSTLNMQNRTRAFETTIKFGGVIIASLSFSSWILMRLGGV